jgi:hypothetical protein
MPQAGITGSFMRRFWINRKPRWQIDFTYWSLLEKVSDSSISLADLF